jgi:hypothetical protein
MFGFLAYLKDTPLQVQDRASADHIRLRHLVIRRVRYRVKGDSVSLEQNNLKIVIIERLDEKTCSNSDEHS